MEFDVVRELLKSASDGQLDPSMRDMVSLWPDEPTPLQVLEVLDRCINGALASGFVVRVLQVAYDETLVRDGLTHEEVVAGAYWRGSTT